MTHHYITFANSPSDWSLVNSLYSEAAGCRITLQSIKRATHQHRPSCKLWVDLGVDGLDSTQISDPSDRTNAPYKEYMRQFPNHSLIADRGFQRKPDRDRIAVFVNAILDEALRAVPNASWLSVPQLPYASGSEKNKINKSMAEVTRQWKSTSSYRGKLILPIIFSKQGQTDLKTIRNPKVDLAAACFAASGAEGVWVVDSKLNDQDGVGNYEDVRFPGLIKFHEELNSRLPGETVTVAGPYWGLNIVLWARGLVKLPAIGLGKSFQFHVAGGRQIKPLVKLALPPLKRLVLWSPALKKWMEEAVRGLPRGDSAYSQFTGILRQIDLLQQEDVARRQVARFYKEWIDRLESVPPTSRALALYQELSAAYVLGTGLRPLPAPEKVKDPARIAKQFMVNCL